MKRIIDQIELDIDSLDKMFEKLDEKHLFKDDIYTDFVLKFSALKVDWDLLKERINNERCFNKDY